MPKPHYNYLKCLDMVPVQPLEWTLTKDGMPSPPGITWEEFDTNVIRPVDLADALVGGKPALDAGRKNAFDDAKAARVTARANKAVNKASARVKLLALNFTEAEIDAL